MPTPDIAAEVERYAAGAVDTARMLATLAEAGTVADVLDADPEEIPEGFAEWIQDHGIEDTDADWFDVLDVAALEVYAVGRFHFHDSSWTVTGIVIVTGIGGPHVEAEISETGRIVGRCYWGGDRAEAVGHDAETLFDRLAEWVEGAR